MTPQEKAKELVDKYFKGSDLLYHDLSWIQSKECAIIAQKNLLDKLKKLNIEDEYENQVYFEINAL